MGIQDSIRLTGTQGTSAYDAYQNSGIGPIELIIVIGIIILLIILGWCFFGDNL